jgi:hypothetical protein
MEATPKNIFAVSAGIIGGAAIGKMAYEHLFVHGLEDKERNKLIGLGFGAVALFGAAYLLGIDEKWLTIEGPAEAVEKWVSP